MRYMFKCKIEGCTSKGRTRCLCKTHYKEWRAANPNVWHTKPKRVRVQVNPYRCLWDTRRKDCVPEWKSLRAFVDGIMPKPEGDYALCKIRKGEPHGPSNFAWRPKIVRGPAETKKAHVARQWQEQKIRHPLFERHRHLKRRFGLTPEQFDQMKEDQGHACAICKRPETLAIRQDEKPRELAIDHCHETGEIRGLLCFDCNTAIGKFGDSIERIEIAIAYLNQHKPKPDLRIVSSN